MQIATRNPGVWLSTPSRWLAVMVPVLALHVAPLALSLSEPRGLNGDSEGALTVAFWNVDGPSDSESTSFLDPGDGNGTQAHHTPAPPRASGSGMTFSKLAELPAPGIPELTRPDSNSTDLPNLTFRERITYRVNSQSRPLASAHANPDEPLDGTPEVKVAEEGDFLTGYVVGQHKKGLGSALDRALGSGGQPHAQTLRLSGRPMYPKACREGLCRDGRPCEGTGSWEITVAAEGGRPLKVECLQRMPCELQNASTRQFFSEREFPKAAKTMTYIFNVTMQMSPNPVISSSSP